MSSPIFNKVPIYYRWIGYWVRLLIWKAKGDFRNLFLGNPLISPSIRLSLVCLQDRDVF
jgi:hypothetical protein